MRQIVARSLCAAFAASSWLASANEITVQNDSLTNNSQGAIVPGFAADEVAAAWLTPSCSGNIVGVDVLWRSLNGGAAQSVEEAIDIYDAAVFPNTGNLLQSIVGPQMTDGVINEFRYLDDQQAVPLVVPVIQNQTYVVAFIFANPPDQTEGPSVVVDTGCHAGKNALFGNIGLGPDWYSSCDLGISGDWVIRAVVDCQSVPSTADIAVTMTSLPVLYTPGSPLTYAITLSNSGPAAAVNTSVVDIFPAAYAPVSWLCTGIAGAICTSGANGNGNITASVNIPPGGQIVYSVTGTVMVGTTGTLTNSAAAVVGSPATDSNTTNNTLTLTTPSITDQIFADTFG